MHFHPQAIVPFLSWLRGYRRPFFKPDLFAGVTVAVVAVPQSMAYALIAGLPVSFGLYTSIVPTIIGCLWGSSSHLITGPTTAVSLVVFSTLSPLVEPNSAGYIEMALFLALMVGALQIIMGVARLGTLLNFVSHAVLIGFTTGAAVLIAFKQLPALLGLKIEKTSVFFEHLFSIITNLHEIEIISLGLGTLTIVIILGFKKFRPNWPGTLLAMVAVGSLVAIFDLDRQGVAVVGAVSGDIPLPGLPDMHLLAQAGKLAPGALAIAILGLVEAVSIAKSIADQTRQRINVNQEFIGQGLANVSAALFSGYAGSGSFTRSAVNFRAGARTPLSGIISGIAVALTVLIAAPLAAKLPISALAGVLVVVAYDMIRVRDIARTLKTTRGDAAVLVITFASTLLLNIEFAIYVGVLLSIGLHLAATSHPRIQSVVPDPATGKMRASSYGETCCQMEIVAIEGSLFFGSAAFVLDDLQRRLRNRPQTANLLIRMHKVNTMDASGVHVLEILLDEVRRRGGGIYFSGVNHGVFLVLKNSGYLNEIGAGKVHATTRAAIRQAMRESFFAAICATCPEIVFEECPALRRGHWEIFGPDIHPRDSQAGLSESGQPAIDQREESHPGAPPS